MRQSKRSITVLLVIIFLSGAITPFVDYLVIIEFFYLIIPFAILLVGSVAYLVGRLFFKGQKDSNAVLLACIMPTLIGSQVVTTYAVDKIQRFRSEQLIKEIESERMMASGPDDSGRIEIVLTRSEDSNSFTISYSRGFLVKEVYDGDSKSWKSFGWND